MANEIYVTPQGETVGRSELTDEQAAAYLGPYTDRGSANGVAALVRSGEMGPDKAGEGARQTPKPKPGSRTLDEVLSGTPGATRVPPAPGQPGGGVGFVFSQPGGGTRTVGLTEARRIMASNRRARKAVWEAVIGVAFFITGIVFASMSYPVVDGVTATPSMCNSGFGILGQAFDTQAYTACQQAGTVSSMHDWAPWMIIFGIVLVVIAVAALAGKNWAKGFIK